VDATLAHVVEINQKANHITVVVVPTKLPEPLRRLLPRQLINSKRRHKREMTKDIPRRPSRRLKKKLRKPKPRRK